MTAHGSPKPDVGPDVELTEARMKAIRERANRMWVAFQTSPGPDKFETLICVIAAEIERALQEGGR